MFQINWNSCFLVSIIAKCRATFLCCLIALFPKQLGQLFARFSGLTSQQFEASPLRALLDWKRNGEKLVRFQLGEFRALVLNDLATLRKAFTNPAVNGRPPFIPIILFSGGELQGTLTTSGDTWKLVRKHTISNLNKTNFGSKPSSEYFTRQLNNLVEELGKKIGTPFDLQSELYGPISACAWYSLTGDEMLDEDKEISRQAFINMHPLMWEPITSDLWIRPALVSVKDPQKIEKLQAVIQPFYSIIENEVTQSLKQEKTNFFTGFLASIRKGGMSQYEAEMHLLGTFMNLWHTSGETLNNVLRWAILYLTLYPDVQQKLAQEILSCEEDPEGIPYFKAVVKEVLRISSSSPFANFHYTTEDTEIEESRVPKGTVVIGNLYGIHHDPETFLDPETFNPERFLSSEAESPDTIPFSLGLRACLGQGFAKNFIYRALTILLKEFEFFWDPNAKLMTANDITELSNVSAFRFAPKHKVVIVRRK